MENTHTMEDVRCIQETTDAILCEVDGKEVWFPKSTIIEAESEVQENGDEGTLVVKQWIAEEKGLV